MGEERPRTGRKSDTAPDSGLLSPLAQLLFYQGSHDVQPDLPSGDDPSS